jgi:molybdopterin converting factor small subunit
MIMMGQQALSYELFSLLSDEIEKKEKLGGDTTAAPLKQLREKLLEVYEALQQQSQELMNRAGATLQGILEAEDRRAAIRERMEEIDDAFMYVLSANIQQLEQRGQTQQAEVLREVHELIMDEMESQAPPEVRLLNQLIRAEDRETRRQILENNRDAVTPQLKQVIQAVIGDAQSAGQEKLVTHLSEVLDLIDDMGVGTGESPSILTP